MICHMNLVERALTKALSSHCYIKRWLCTCYYVQCKNQSSFLARMWQTLWIFDISMLNPSHASLSPHRGQNIIAMWGYQITGAVYRDTLFSGTARRFSQSAHYTFTTNCVCPIAHMLVTPYDTTTTSGYYTPLTSQLHFPWCPANCITWGYTFS